MDKTPKLAKQQNENGEKPMDSILKQQAERKVIRPSETKFAPSSRDKQKWPRTIQHSAA